MSKRVRYRICGKCKKRWNVSAMGPSPWIYICPECAEEESARDGEEEKRC